MNKDIFQARDLEGNEVKGDLVRSEDGRLAIVPPIKVFTDKPWKRIVMQLVVEVDPKTVKRLNNEKDGLILNLRKDKDAYKRDSEKYLAMLEQKKICLDCGTVDAVCDCPFG
ncbi:hypothetical protein LCGC14_0934770 [marine sediment metagenome]|uniref:Uncharacterized protein n=1 Tax=marine sediment metagenome TaxID=412755 RepID=A0A0F9NLV9_9ZZZZ